MKLSIEIQNEIIKYSFEVGDTTQSGEAIICPRSIELFSDIVKTLPHVVFDIKKPVAMKDAS